MNYIASTTLTSATEINVLKNAIALKKPRKWRFKNLKTAKQHINTGLIITDYLQSQRQWNPPNGPTSILAMGPMAKDIYSFGGMIQDTRKMERFSYT